MSPLLEEIPLNATWKRSRGLVVIVGLAAVLAACGSSSKSSTSTGGGSGTTTINGSGSTFQQTFDEAAIQGFQQSNSSVKVNYAGGGSGKGKTDLQTKTVEFAGTDSLPKPSELSSYQGGKLLYFPTVVAPITVSYNLSGVKSLRLSDPTLAKIFAVKITKWNDPAIMTDNPGVTLPSTSITVVHRADGSGTTSNFTKYLTEVDPTDWTLGSGDTVNWASNTQAGTGNGGVAQIVKQTSGAIGYVDLADATASGLTAASIQNKAGSYVAPTLAGAAAAVAATVVSPDLSYSPINAGGAKSYPITSPTWIIAYVNQSSKAQGTALKSFLQYIYGPGQGLATQAGYAPLPQGVVQKAALQLGKMQIPS
jgi:phosphate transport system substrate-binding protein